MCRLGAIIVLACCVSAWAGWSEGKGSWNKRGQWYHGSSRPYSQYRHNGKGGSAYEHGGSMNGSMAMLADLLEKNAASRRSRRSKLSSRSRSSSARDQRGKRRSSSASKELRELRKYKEETEAMRKAEQEKEKQVQEKLLREQELKDLEARILKKFPDSQPVSKRSNGASASSIGSGNRDRSSDHELQPLALKAIDWILDKCIDLSEVNSWQGIEEKLSSLDNNTLKDLFAKKITDSNIPRSKAQKVSQILEFLVAEVQH